MSRRYFRALWFVPLCLVLGLAPGPGAVAGDSQALLYYRVDFGVGTAAAGRHGVGLALYREPDNFELSLSSSVPVRPDFLHSPVGPGSNLEWVRYGDGRGALRLNGLDLWSTYGLSAADGEGEEDRGDEEAEEGAEEDSKISAWFKQVPVGVLLGITFGGVALGGIVD